MVALACTRESHIVYLVRISTMQYTSLDEASRSNQAIDK